MCILVSSQFAAATSEDNSAYINCYLDCSHFNDVISTLQVCIHWLLLHVPAWREMWVHGLAFVYEDCKRNRFCTLKLFYHWSIISQLLRKWLIVGQCKVPTIHQAGFDQIKHNQTQLNKRSSSVCSCQMYSGEGGAKPRKAESLASFFAQPDSHTEKFY